MLNLTSGILMTVQILTQTKLVRDVSIELRGPV